MVGLELHQELRHRIPLEAFLRAAEIAWDDRERELRGVLCDVGLGALDQRADHLEAAIVGAIARRHRLELARVEQIEEERLERVIAMMTEGDLVAAESLGRRVQDAATQARTQRAVRGGLGEMRGDHRVGVLAEDLEALARGFEERAQPRSVIAGLCLIEVHRDDLDREREPRDELGQEVKQHVAVLAT